MVWNPSMGAPFPTASAPASAPAAPADPIPTAGGGMTGLGGSLPWQSQSSPFPDLSGSPAEVMSRLGPAYKNAYDSSLRFNESLYNRADQGYRDIAAFNTSAGEALRTGHTDLSKAVLGHLEGVGAARATAIDDAFTQANADAQQSLISRGLGNTTVLDSQRRSSVSDRERARTALSNDLANQYASFQSQLGGNALQSRENQIGRELAGGYRHMDFLNSVQAAYPDAGMYASIAQQMGAAQQADADRGLLRDQIAAQNNLAAMAGRGGPGGGGMSLDTVPFGGGVARGTRDMAGPAANYGGTAGGMSAPSGFSFGVGSPASAGFNFGGGAAAAAPPAAPTTSIPYLGAGTGWSGGGVDYQGAAEAVTGGVFGALGSMGITGAQPMNSYGGYGIDASGGGFFSGGASAPVYENDFGDYGIDASGGGFFSGGYDPYFDDGTLDEFA